MSRHRSTEPAVEIAADRAYSPGSGLPLALPVAPDSAGASSQVTRADRQIRGTTTPRLTTTRTAGACSAGEGGRSPQTRVSRRRLSWLHQHLAERDRAALQLIARHRFLTSHHLQALVFHDHASDASAGRTTRRVLARLESWQLLRSLPRRVGGLVAGSAPTVWQLAPAGARLLRTDGQTYRVSQPSLQFLRHCLAIADMHVLLHDLTRQPAPDGQGIQTVDVQIEAEAWRRYTGPGGEPRWLQPDLAVVVTTRDYEDRWFIEVDLGTESLPTLLRKCGQYQDYRTSGNEQQTHGVFPLVLWFMNDESRAVRLQTALRRSPTLDPRLYRIATPDTVAQTIRGDQPDGDHPDRAGGTP